MSQLEQLFDICRTRSRPRASCAVGYLRQMHNNLLVNTHLPSALNVLQPPHPS